MLILSEFSHNYHPSGVNLLVKIIRRGFSVIIIGRDKTHDVSIGKKENDKQQYT